MAYLSEVSVEEAVLYQFAGLGYTVGGLRETTGGRELPNLAISHHRERNKAFPNYRNRRIMTLRSQGRPPLEAAAFMPQEIFAEGRLSTCGGHKCLKLLKAMSRKALTKLDKT